MEGQPVNPLRRHRNQWRQALAQSLTLRSGSIGAVDSVPGGRKAPPEHRDSSFEVLIYLGTLHHIADTARGLAEIQRVPLSSGLLCTRHVWPRLLGAPVRAVAADAACLCRTMPHRRQKHWV